MIVINEAACSKEFNAALAALNSGIVARRASWPSGMFLRKCGESIAVYRDGKFSAPTWYGPSAEESTATNWETV